MVTRPKHFQNLHDSSLIKFFNHSERLISKMSLLVICEILEPFVNTLTANDKYFLCYRKILSQQIPIQLPNKQKTFSQLIAAFLNLHQISNILKEEMTFIADVVPKLQTVQHVAR